jgi:hypothetical protein
MDVLGDLVVRDRRSPDPALRHADSGRTYDYRRFCTTTWKAGNYLRLLGVRTGARVAIADDPTPEAVLSAYGAALLGGVVRFDPAPDETEARVLVCPAADLDSYEVGPSTKRVVYGAEPEDPSVGYFERDVWSENPTESPNRVEADDALLDVSGETYTHGEVVARARGMADDWDLGSGDEVAVRGPFDHPGTVTAGLVAPILAGAAILLPGADGDGDYAVGEGGPGPAVSPDDRW